MEGKIQVKTIIFSLTIMIMILTSSLNLAQASPTIPETMDAGDTFVFDEKQDFNNGTFNGTCVDEDGKLNSIIYENFTDFAKVDQIIPEYNILPFTYNLGYAEQSTVGANSIGFLVNENGTELDNIKNFSTRSRLYLGSSPKTYLGIGHKEDRPTDSALMTHIIEIYYTYAWVGYHQLTLRMRYLNDTGVANYWDGDSWETSGYVVLALPSNAGNTYSAHYESDGTSFNLTVYDNGYFNNLNTLITRTDNVNLTDVNHTGENYWAMVGSEYSVNGDNRVHYYKLQEESTTWQSSILNSPDGYSIQNINFTIENGLENVRYIDRIEILDESNNTLDYCDTNMFSSGSYTISDFNNNLASVRDVNFTIKVYYFNGDHEEMMFINEMRGDFNILPIADAGIDQFGEFGTHNLDGSVSSDPDGTIANYTWSFTYNASTEYLYGSTPSFYFWTTGTYNITLNVTDNDGGTDEDWLILTVNNTNPTADAGADQFGGYATYNFDGSNSSDVDGSIVNYTWSFTYNASTEYLYGSTPSFYFFTIDVYNITLNVTDDNAGTDEDWLSLNITAYPVADAGIDASVRIDNSLSFDGSNSSSSTNYTWTFTYDGELQTLYGENPSFLFEIRGAYTVSLTVKNELGMEDTDEVVITVITFYDILFSLIVLMLGIFILIVIFNHAINQTENAIGNG